MYILIRRRFSLVACLALICLGVSACGGSAAPTQSATPTKNMTLTVCQGSNSITFFPFYVAQQQGYFKAQKLDIANPAILQVGSKVAAAVEAGSCQMGDGVITDAFNWSKVDK